MRGYTWNPVFNFAIDIKHRCEQEFGSVDYKEHEIEYIVQHEVEQVKGNKVKFIVEDEVKTKSVSCLEYWINMLDDENAKEKAKYLEINEKNEFVLIRYGRFSSAEEGQGEITAENIWEVDNGFFLECRSIVLNLKKEEIVIAPFKKFRNLNECPANELSVVMDEIKNASSIEISNKLDGSMQCARWYDNKLFMSGSQAVDPAKSWRLEDGISMLSSNHETMLKENEDFTFVFEYISLEDAHVVKYEKEQEGLYLIGIRNVYTGRQCTYKEILEFASRYNVYTTEVYDKSFEDILEEIKTIKSDDAEGFVVNIDGHMIKVKGDDYVQIHKILSKISSVNLVIQSIAENRMDDLLSKVPMAYKQRVEDVAKIVNAYTDYMEKTTQGYYDKAPKDGRKEFMIWTESNVPKKYKSHVRNKYIGVKNNYLKYGSDKCPGYRKLNEMGVENYKSIFTED